jgi:predicted nucleic acid-binding protein
MVWIPFCGNSLVADASSLIYLAKASIIRSFLESFEVTVPPSVYRELVREGYPHSEKIRRLSEDGSLVIQPVKKHPGLNPTLLRGGERDVILLFYQLGSDGILIDDGAGVRACRQCGIPFVSALLVPSLLLIKDTIDAKQAKKSLDKIEEIGRYSREVILYARTCFSQAIGAGKGSIDRRDEN